MTALATRRIALSTGVSLDVTLGGDGPAIIFLHGFPESRRTWRHQLAALSRDYRVVAPDQRGYARSDKPEGVEQYETGRIVDDLIALADTLGIGRFTSVGHDWGGAAAWLAALRHGDRIERLVIVNAPHPLIFQKSLIDDEEQRAASQYIRAFRSPLIEAGIAVMGLDTFFDKTFGAHADLSKISEEERRAYLDEWSQPGAMTAMLNWYRAAAVEVPEVGEKASRPAWTHGPFPKLSMPVLVIWGMRDKALLPVQLEGLNDLIEDLRIVPLDDTGHFAPWENPDAVTGAIDRFMKADLARE